MHSGFKTPLQVSLPLNLHRAAGGLMAIALVVGPLNYGSTRSVGIWSLVSIISAAVLCWTASLAFQRRLPSTPLPVLIGLGALALASLLWISGAAQPTTSADFTREHFSRVVARWPQSVVGVDMNAAIALHAGFALTLWMASDLFRDRNWVLILASVMVATGVIVSLLALLQSHTHATGIFWRHEGRMPGRFWGTFFHHTSAGAYLNTVWPMAAGLALMFQRSIPTKLVRAGLIASILGLILLLGAHATHISRFPQVAALVILPILIWSLNRHHSLLTAKRWVALVALGVVVIALSAGRLGEISERWRLVNFTEPKNVRAVPPENTWPQLVRADLLIPNLYNAGAFGDRGEAQRTAWRAIMDRPLTGHGPANWMSAASRHTSDPYVRSFYLYLQFAHEDFLQAWAEWGIGGLVSLLLLLPGAVIAVLWSASSATAEISIPALCAAAGLSIVLMQSLFDFPLQIPAVALNASVLAGLCWSCFRVSDHTAPLISTAT